MSPALTAALKWLTEHNSDGLFGKDGVLVAGGERAPHMRSTWNELRALGKVDFYRPVEHGAQRVRVVRP